MELFDREDLKQLAHVEDDLCVSLYMPTVRFEAELSQNPIRYKNLLRAARDQLLSQGYRQDEVEEVLAAAHRQLDNTSFWRGMSEGLAAFVTSTSTRFYRLPLSFDEIVVTGDRLHLKPLFPLIASNNRYYVLALGRRDVRLYQGTHQALSAIRTIPLPDDLLEALPRDETVERFHAAPASSNPPRRPADGGALRQNGTPNEAGETPQAALKDFFRTINRSLAEDLDNERAPLVLVGVKAYLPLYRAVNTYPYLVDDQIVVGQPAQWTLERLHEKVWNVVEPVFLEAQDHALERFNFVYYTDGDMASDDFREIVPAAVFSRVDTLFVPIGHHRWGRYDATSNAVEVHDEQQPGDDDLLNYAAVHAYLNGATVHALRPENMPNGFGLAATFRYVADVSASEQ